MEAKLARSRWRKMLARWTLGDVRGGLIITIAVDQPFERPSRDLRPDLDAAQPEGRSQ